jgi:hypothetical protein
MNFSHKAVTVQGGYGAVFAIQVQSLLSITRVAVQVYRSNEFITGYKVGCEHWRSVAVQTISKPEICHGAGFKLCADARVRVQESLQICFECRSKSKNCDEQLTHIVRVRWS